jgi:hypothetical protein
MERVSRRGLFAMAAAAPLAGLAGAAPPAGGRKARLRTAICAYSFRKELESKKMSYNDLLDLAVNLDVDRLDLTVYWFPDKTDAFLIRCHYAFANGGDSVDQRTDSAANRRRSCAPRSRPSRWVDVAVTLGAGHIRVFGGTVPGIDRDRRRAG